MSDTKTDKAAAPARATEPRTDPDADPQAVLFNARSSAADLKKARAAFSAIAGAQRPWEQLPSMLKSAARADARRVLGAAGDAGTLIDAGYSAHAARRLMQDLGRS